MAAEESDSTATCSTTVSSPAFSGSDCTETSKRLPSDVWKHFVKLKETRKAECKICQKKLAYHGGTTNLREHLVKVHPFVYKRESPKQLCLQSCMRQKFCSSARTKAITDKIVRMIILDLRPIRVVECAGFKDLVLTLEPGYVMPTRKSVKKMIFNMYEQSKSKMIDLLHDASSISLTTDIWTSLSNDAYISLSAHWISDSWELVTCVLAAKEFPGSHTGVAISEKIAEMVKEFKIQDKVSVIVHDQAANMQLSLRLLQEPEQNLDGSRLESLPCNAHKLQLCLKAGLAINTIDRMIRCASKLVGHFRHSALASGALKTRQHQMNVDEKKLIQSSATRWNSTYYMLDRLVEQRWPVVAVLSDESVTKRSDRHLDLSNEQWKLAEELIRILKPFEVATTVFCGEQHSTVSCTLPIVYGLTKHLEIQDDDSQCSSISSFKHLVLSEIKQRWSLDNLDVSSCMVLSAVLDPRFKPLKVIDEIKMEEAKLELKVRITALPPAAQQCSINPSSPAAKRTKTKTALDILLGEEEAQTTGPLGPSQEIDQFLSEKPIPKEGCVLDWWKNTGTSKYPKLSAVAKDLLGIPSTSATSERMFSTAGLTASKLRSTLKPDHVEALIFLNKNLKFLSK